MRSFFSGLLSFMVFLVSSSCLSLGQDIVITKIGERKIPHPLRDWDWPVRRVNFPYFDATGRLEWDDTLNPNLPSDCILEEAHRASGTYRITHLQSPRVDEIYCYRGYEDGFEKKSSFRIAGIADSKVAWSQISGFRSGGHLFQERIIGADKKGIVLSTLRVISPVTGETIFPAPVHGHASTQVPDYSFVYSGLFLPQQRQFLLFDADVQLFRRKGGLWLLDTSKGQRELVLPVSTTLLGGHWRIKNMVASEDESLIFLAQELETRGAPRPVSLTIFDLRRHKIVFTEKFSEKEHYGSDPKVIVNGDNIGFSYLDQNDGQHVLVHYRINSLSSLQMKE